MNLTTDPWIPAVRGDGSRALFSLLDLFAQAHELRDLAVKPHERIALMRLLLCITQAALDGPEDEADWEDCRDRIQPRVNEYLEKWNAKFELFGDGERFLQVSNLKPAHETKEGNPATKLDLSLSTGSNPTLFDNSAGDKRSVDKARAALNLLAFQCFSPSGTIGVAKWNGEDTPGSGSSKHAPCLPSNMIHALLLGDSLLATLHLNLLNNEVMRDVPPGKIGRPVWEQPPKGAGDVGAVENATVTHLGRLVPFARSVRLDVGGTSIILANGLEFPPFPASREATATIVLKKKDELGMLSATPERSLWRQLAPIAVRRQASKDAISGPLALMHAPKSSDTALWVGALIMNERNAAKIEDVVEALYRMPPEMLDAPGRAAYERGVNHADKFESALKQAVHEYVEHVLEDDPKKSKSKARDAKARQHFWTRVEQSLSALFDVARELTSEEELPASEWGRAVRAAALDAYRQSCPRQTPRQIQAYALGLRRLNASSKSKSTRTTKVTSNE